ncbi:MAG: VOC family protein [Rhodobacteraceae bacterium]|nr:VOC family protein [Paracoccaceae bacterium]
MQPAILEHANISVSDPKKTAANLCDIFGWHIRWSGDAKETGYTVIVGTDEGYLAVYAEKSMENLERNKSRTIGDLNHIGVVVEDLKAVEDRVIAAGFTPGEHFDYKPGERFYFFDHDNIEFEVVSYA